MFVIFLIMTVIRIRMAPEVRTGTSYGLPADVYSLGILLFELFEQKLPEFDFERQTIVLESYDFLVRPIFSGPSHLPMC